MLRQPGLPDPLPPLIAEFIETAENRMDEIQSSIVSHDATILERAAHSLRGSAGGIGALRLSALAAELEEDARQNSLHRAADLLSQMESEFTSVRHALEFERER